MADKQYKSLSESVSRIGNIRAGTAPRSAADCTAQEVNKAAHTNAWSILGRADEFDTGRFQGLLDLE
jgi:hypothetical protein